MNKKVYLGWVSRREGVDTDNTAEGYVIGWESDGSLLLALSKYNEKTYNISKGETFILHATRDSVVKIEGLKDIINTPLTKETLTKETLTKFDMLGIE